MQRECALQSFSPNQFKLTFWLDVQTDKQILSKSQNSLSLNLTYNFLSAIYITMKQCFKGLRHAVIGNSSIVTKYRYSAFLQYQRTPKTYKRPKSGMPCMKGNLK